MNRNRVNPNCFPTKNPHNAVGDLQLEHQAARIADLTEQKEALAEQLAHAKASALDAQRTHIAELKEVAQERDEAQAKLDGALFGAQMLRQQLAERMGGE